MAATLLTLSRSLWSSPACDELKLSDCKAYLALPLFPTGAAFLYYRTGVTSATGTGRAIKSRPRAVAFLPKQFATNTAIKNALDDLRALRPNPGETKDEFHTRFVEAHERTGYPLDVNERITSFIDGLNPKIRPSIHVFRDEKEREQLYLQGIATRARLKGDELPASEENSTPLSRNMREATRRNPRASRSVSYADDIKETPQVVTTCYMHGPRALVILIPREILVSRPTIREIRSRPYLLANEFIHRLRGLEMATLYHQSIGQTYAVATDPLRLHVPNLVQNGLVNAVADMLSRLESEEQTTASTEIEPPNYTGQTQGTVEDQTFYTVDRRNKEESDAESENDSVDDEHELLDEVDGNIDAIMACTVSPRCPELPHCISIEEMLQE